VAPGDASQAQRGIVKIRPAREDDIEAIHAVHVRAMQHLRETSPQGTEQGQKGVDAYIAGRQPSDIAEEMHEQRFLVVENGTGILGFGALRVPKNEITMVFVSPQHQQTGIGRALLAELESIARRENLEVLQLQATGTAIEFYLKTGYQSDPPVEPGADWALMKKQVS
jgi:N-acetylglutamate synthase-like GNAT family acetyltransferase